MVKKAIVLAAGYGKRLRPLTATVPKPLLPVWGEEMLSRIIDILEAKGVTDIAVNCHYLADKVESWCKENGFKVSREDEILGTGGALIPLKDWIDGDEFYLVNGDIVIDGLDDIDFEKALHGRPLAGTETIAAALVTDEAGPRTIEVEPESSLVTNWASLEPGANGTYTYCGFALLKPEIFDYIKPEGFSTIVEAYDKAMMAGKFVKAVTGEELLWTDAGTIDSYIAINEAGEDNAFGEIPHVEAFNGEKPEFLGARGSDRAFFRCDKGIVVVYDDSKRGENAKYAAHSEHLVKHGVNVAKVIDENKELKTLLMEDAGSEDLGKIATKGGEERMKAYEKAIEALKKFSATPVPENAEPAFGPEMWEWERNLFKEYCLNGRYGLEMDREVEEELKKVAEVLEREPKALVHRDYQSTNILFKDGEVKIIDYQGMRGGPSVYDLASLLYDPYVDLSKEERKILAEKAGGNDALAYAGVERLVQALGAFGRLAHVGHSEFEKHIARALENLEEAAAEAGLAAVGEMARHLSKHEKGECG